MKNLNNSFSIFSFKQIKEILVFIQGLESVAIFTNDSNIFYFKENSTFEKQEFYFQNEGMTIGYSFYTSKNVYWFLLNYFICLTIESIELQGKNLIIKTV